MLRGCSFLQNATFIEVEQGNIACDGSLVDDAYTACISKEVILWGFSFRFRIATDFYTVRHTSEKGGCSCRMHEKQMIATQAGNNGFLSPSARLSSFTDRQLSLHSLFPHATERVEWYFLRLVLTEVFLKEYFAKVVGPVKSVILQFGANGKSRGIATIAFNKVEDAKNAYERYNGVAVDGRPMKV